MPTNSSVPREAEPVAGVVVKIIRNDKGSFPGKLADAELHFTEGLLAGLKMIGFSLWQRRVPVSEGVRRNNRSVTFPARQYSVNGERRSFALLRPIEDPIALEGIRDLILSAYAEHEATAVPS